MNVILIIKESLEVGKSAPISDFNAKVLMFDATVDQSFNHTATVVDHPVSDGSKITDHIVIEPSKFMLTGVISDDHFVKDLATFAAFGGGLLAAALANNKNAVTEVTTAATAIGAGLQAFNTLSSFGSDRTGDAYELLKFSLKAGKTVDVFTPTEVIFDCVMESMQVDRDAKTGKAQYFKLGFREIRTVSPQTVETRPDNSTRKLKTTAYKANGKAVEANRDSAAWNIATAALNFFKSFF
jgi:hypothetical protein